MRGRKYSNGVCYKHKGSFKLKRFVALLLTLLMIFTSLPPMSVYAQIEAADTAASDVSDQTLWTSSDPLLTPAESPSAETSAPVDASSPDVTITQDTPSATESTPAPAETTSPEENTTAAGETPVTDETVTADATTPAEETATTGETTAPTEDSSTEEPTTPAESTNPEDTAAPGETATTEEPVVPEETTTPETAALEEVVPAPEVNPLMTPMMEPLAVTPDAAENIILGTPYNIMPFFANSTQYYKFTTNAAGTYTITYTVSPPGGPVLTMHLGTVSEGNFTSLAQDTAGTISLPLEAGVTYYLQLINTGMMGPVNLIVNEQTLPNSITNPDTLSLGENYQVAPFPAASPRYYKFDITTAGTYTATYSIATPPGGPVLAMSLGSVSGETFNSLASDTAGTIEYTFATAGTYYLQVVNSGTQGMVTLLVKEKLPPPAAPTASIASGPITADQLVDGKLNVTFTSAAGTTIYYKEYNWEYDSYSNELSYSIDFSQGSLASYEIYAKDLNTAEESEKVTYFYYWTTGELTMTSDIYSQNISLSAKEDLLYVIQAGSAERYSIAGKVTPVSGKDYASMDVRVVDASTGAIVSLLDEWGYSFYISEQSDTAIPVTDFISAAGGGTYLLYLDGYGNGASVDLTVYRNAPVPPTISTSVTPTREQVGPNFYQDLYYEPVPVTISSEDAASTIYYSLMYFQEGNKTDFAVYTAPFTLLKPALVRSYVQKNGVYSVAATKEFSIQTPDAPVIMPVDPVQMIGTEITLAGT
ncbi:MAG: hypothetical protein H6Q64_138, partial [Firmicutes bacterium]|nr:hypothetical protein [Bacillota bacterium]